MASTNSQEILQKIEEQIPPDNQRLQNYVAALKVELAKDAEQAQELNGLVEQYTEAYNKLTSPANRIALFMKWFDEEKGFALIAIGDTEYVAQVDPVYDGAKQLKTGDRVRINEAYAIIGLAPASETGTVTKVDEVLKDGRIKIGDELGRGGRFVIRSAELESKAIKSGDSIRLDPSGRFAVEHYEGQETQDYFLETIPELPWESVGGQESAIKLIRETIEQPLLYPELFERFQQKPIKGILLYGPPGCGKTLLGKATAYNLTREYSKRVGHEVKEYFMAISGPKILNMWLGETERMVREIFKTAREKAAEGRLVFIFMDEAESVLRTRSGGRYLNISNTVVPQFCAELDGLQSLDNVVLMLTSNRPDYIDPAILRPERIDRKVKISRPGKADTHQILGIYLNENIPLDPDLIKASGSAEKARESLLETLTDEIWEKTKANEFVTVALRSGSVETLYRKDLLSGAVIKAIVDRAKNSAIQRAISSGGGEAGVNLADLSLAAETEFKENEIFPKSDLQEDWLQLLDYSPENVASVRPVGERKGERFIRQNVL